MRINAFIAAATGLSRRRADKLVANGRIMLNGHPAALGSTITSTDQVKMDGKLLRPVSTQTILLNKPIGFVCSRAGQGSKTIYDLIPAELHHLKPVGRLDKDSSGLLLLTNDGRLANQLTHPKFNKEKAYEIELDKSLTKEHQQKIQRVGVMLEDGLSKLQLQSMNDHQNSMWQVTMSEGRNRQIRRTFAVLGYKVRSLHRVRFGNYTLSGIRNGEYRIT